MLALPPALGTERKAGVNARLVGCGHPASPQFGDQIRAQGHLLLRLVSTHLQVEQTCSGFYVGRQLLGHFRRRAAVCV